MPKLSDCVDTHAKAAVRFFMCGISLYLPKILGYVVRPLKPDIKVGAALFVIFTTWKTRVFQLLAWCGEQMGCISTDTHTLTHLQGKTCVNWLIRCLIHQSGGTSFGLDDIVLMLYDITQFIRPLAIGI